MFLLLMRAYDAELDQIIGPFLDYGKPGAEPLLG
jgi:hypothetical protein